MSRGFVTGGTWCLDRNLSVPYWPAEDMSAPVLEVELSGGGCGCNFACDLRRLDPGVPVSTIGLLGDDEAGRFLRQVAAEHGVDHRRLRVRAGASSQVTDAYHVTTTGRRTHMLFAGTASWLCPDDFEFTPGEARYAHIGLPGIHPRMDAAWGEDANGWVTVLRAAQAAGLHTNLELVTVPAPRLRELVLPCLPHLDSLVVNDYEIGALAEVQTVLGEHTFEDACWQAARQVMAAGRMSVLVVHFTQGALLLTREGLALRQGSVRVPLDAHHGANGAGDAFAAGFFLGLHRGDDWQHCLRLGHAAAAACLQSPSPSGGVRPWSECLAQADAWGWR
ncbi:MAG: hypothetical protein RIQ60_464 [Pseudomonadota bacterium]|jgi:sugar/nucleoside kinase (ribokinase family)